jgi:hypothetical protein
MRTRNAVHEGIGLLRRAWVTGCRDRHRHGLEACTHLVDFFSKYNSHDQTER